MPFNVTSHPDDVPPLLPRLLDICHGQRSEQGNQLILVLVFEHVDQDLSAYLEKCPPPGLSPGVIKVGPPPAHPTIPDLITSARTDH